MRRPRDGGSIVFFLALALLCGIAGAYCPGCRSCVYCYLQYPSNTSAQCNPFQGQFILNCAVAGPSSSLIVINWQVDGIKYQSNTGSYMVSTPPCGFVGDVQMCTSKLSGTINDPSKQHNYSCIVSSAQGVDMFSSNILHISPPSGDSARTSCTTYSFTANDTQCASNQSLTCTPSSSSIVSLSSRPSTTVPTTAAVQPTHHTNVHLYTSEISSDSVHSTGLPDNTLKFLQPTVTVDLNPTGDVNTSTRMWLYVVAGIATVFALTIIILSVLCLALCLKRSQTADTDTLKSQEPTQSIRMRFSSTGDIPLSDIPHALSPRCERAAPPPDSSSLYSSDQPNDSGVPKTITTTTTTAGNLDRDYDIITPLPTTHQYSRLYRPSLSPSPPQQDGLNSRQHSFCTTATVLTDLGSFRVSGEPFEMADMATKRTNGHIYSPPDAREALYCITSLSSLHHQANQLWSSNETTPISPPAPTSSAAPSASNIVYHVLESTASERSGTGATGVVAGGTETAGTTGASEDTFQDTLLSQPFPVHDSEDTPFPLVHYEAPISSLIQNGTLDGTDSIRSGNQACSLYYSLPPDAVAATNSSAMQFADYSELDEQSVHPEDVQAMSSTPNVQTSRNYEVLSATTIDPKSCYTRLKLGKHTVV